MENSKTAIEKLYKKIMNKAAVTVRENGMISPGDHILLGLSGGKDSMVMLEFFANRKAALPFDFNITAAHIRVKGIGYEADSKEMERICSTLGIDYINKVGEISEVVNKTKGTCFLCSWNRRKALFDLTMDLNCNKLALGHHRKDALETLLLNMIYHGSISSLPYTLSMFEGRITLIRPLLDMEEKLLEEYASLRGFNCEGVKCAFEKKNHRDEVRKLIADIESLNGAGSINMFRAMDKIFEEYLPQKKARIS